MSQSTPTERESPNDVYLPAVASPALLVKVEAALRKTIGRHGLVPLPDTYNE